MPRPVPPRRYTRTTGALEAYEVISSQIGIEQTQFGARMVDLDLDRDDPITEIIATAIVSITSRGERDPATIKDRALNTLDSGRLDADAA